MSLRQRMYNNSSVSNQVYKTPLCDYQKIQSTQHGSQIFGQIQFMLGGPTSGHHDSMVRDVHNDKTNFKQVSPSPNRTFDAGRGASPEFNSYNTIKQFMPSREENPRLTVL